MHELSIAQSIIDISTEHSVKQEQKDILEINIEIGELSGIIMEALKFALEVLVKETVLEKAKFNFIPIPGKANCVDCDISFEMQNFFDTCPLCRGLNRTITNGKQLLIKSIKY
ncbi:MAG: hydrogenase maturation nickel metallochaperone HypA [Mariniphaga sp.]|nr:hydrogenase maturation nickel metallochaperone HypA [Mariniphaga sp.]